jgi:hypothetical protein
MIALHSNVVASSNQVSSDLAGEVVILNMANGSYYGLDEVGARIWKLLQQPCSPQAISEVLLDEYDVGPDECRRDVLELVRQLADEGLVELRDARLA